MVIPIGILIAGGTLFLLSHLILFLVNDSVTRILSILRIVCAWLLAIVGVASSLYIWHLL